MRPPLASRGAFAGLAAFAVFALGAALYARTVHYGFVGWVARDMLARAGDGS